MCKRYLRAGMRYFLLFIVLLPVCLTAQSRGKLNRARGTYAAGNYAETVRTLRGDGRLVADDPEAALLLAVSLFHTNRLGEAKTELERLIIDRGDNFPVARFYLGRVYHAQNLFPDAAEEYKRYSRTLDQEGEAWLTVTTLLRNVANGLSIISESEQLLVDNLGPSVNTPEDEFAPIPSPGGTGQLYFTATYPNRGRAANADIYLTAPTGEGWSAPKDLNPLQNTSANETLVDISADGRKIFYFRGGGAGAASMREGDYLVDTFRVGGNQSVVTIAPEVALSQYHEDVTPYFSAPDGLYFASNRPEGYGGLDLYRRERLEDGSLGPVKNLGPAVNGPYDEICPFVARDGRTLYFSTNDPDYSVGGFDVVRSFRVIGGAGRFTLPVNLGIPTNSAGDDTHFRLAPDTFSGFLASDRKDGYGKRDLYVIYYSSARKEMQVNP